MSTDRTQRLVARREQRRSRSAAVIVTLVLLAVVAAWIGTESVLAYLAVPALLVDPRDGVEALAEPALAAPVGAALAVLGVILVVLAVAPARRPRHAVGDDRAAFIVDDDIVAGAISRAAATAASVPRNQVTTSVRRRRALVTVQPSSGFPVDESRVRAAVDDLLDRVGTRPRLRAAVQISKTGKVGA